MKAERIVLSWGLPKTGQRIEYAAGDDGTYEAGWWQGLTMADNKVRFISKTIDGEAVVIDQATGLMWFADGAEEVLDEGEAMNWLSAISLCNGIEFAGFDDWRLPNINELLSLFRRIDGYPHYYPAYFDNLVGTYWTSNTDVRITTKAYTMSFTSGYVSYGDKVTAEYHVLPVRGGL